jgi:molecular chaperone GrpE (heat shock protein)
MPTRKHKPEAEAETPVVPAAETEARGAEPSPELAAVQAKAQEYLDGWQRERADFFNYKRRIEALKMLSEMHCAATWTSQMTWNEP